MNSTKLSELKPGMRRVDATVTVKEISPPREITTRRGDQSRIATAVVTDESGVSIKLNLWNEQIDQVKAGATVQVGNGYVDSFRGETQLNIGRYGTLNVVS